MTDNRYARKDWIPAEATSVTRVNLVGIPAACDPKNYPLKSGNCFSVLVGDVDFHILNFNHENLDALIRTGVISYPIKVLLVGPNYAVIHDIRIPHDWYSSFCPSCSPLELLPPEHRLMKWRQFEAGEITISGGGGLLTMESQKIGGEKKSLRMEWHQNKDGTKSFEAVTVVETPPSSIWVKNGKVVKKVGGSVKKIRHDAGIPGTKGKPPTEITDINIEKCPVKAVSKSMKLPKVMGMDIARVTRKVKKNWTPKTLKECELIGNPVEGDTYGRFIYLKGKWKDMRKNLKKTRR